MLYVSQILAVRFHKMIDDLRREHPELLDSQILGVLEIIKYQLISSSMEEPEDDGDQHENSETN